MYGRQPSAPTKLKYKLFDETPNALGGKAIRKQVTIYYSADEKGPSMDLLLYNPAKAKAKAPVPAFLGINFGGNQAIHKDPGIKLSTSWMRPNMMIALMAPRPDYVASAERDRHADPHGEILSVLHAEPVYQLFGAASLGVKELPPLDQPKMGTLGYHIRTGIHDVTGYDWKCYLDFADKQFGK